MHIEVLSFQGCPHAEPCAELVARVVERLAPGTAIVRIEVDSEELAARLGFLGSPSVRIDGVDLERKSTDRGALSCRRYVGGGGLPSEALVEAAVARARLAREPTPGVCP